jgi:cellulose synthase/poly-beta-1,6-N-acetylglucosamine synthase-like glycosyltransferase
MRLLFWVSALTIVYVYAGYPLLLTIWARLRPRRLAAEPVPAISTAECPTISIVIAARNEAARLPARIGNLLSLAYPAGRRQIIVVSDGSTDDTLAVLSRFPEVQAIAGPARGKAAALNLGVARATGDILVFADARQMFAPDALRALVAPFADRSVGGVTGELLLDCEASPVAGHRSGDTRRRLPGDRRLRQGRGQDRRRGDDRRGRRSSTIGDGVRLYWRYEKRLRRLESAVGSTLGATGAIYALRRTLYQPLPEDTILDDVLAPMRAVLGGYRVIFTDRAIAFDHAAADADVEQRRKVRTLAGNVQILLIEPRLLVPVVNPVWLQYVSHKVGRLIVPYCLMTLFAASVALAAQAIVYAAALAAQCGFYLLGGYGAWLDFVSRPAAEPRPGESPTLVGALAPAPSTDNRIANA